MFGFSRGAYTARALAGMLYTVRTRLTAGFVTISVSELICIRAQVGLLPREMPEQVDFAYSIFKNG